MHPCLSVAAAIGLLLLAPAAASYEVTEFSGGGTITGKISVAVKGLRDESLTIGKDSAFCGGSVPAEKYLVAPDGGLKNVVVMIEGIEAGKPFPSETDFVIANKNCRFDPHVMVAPKGAMMTVRNDDPVLHNAHFYQVKSESRKRNVVNLALPRKGAETSKENILHNPGLVSVECDANHFMQGWLWVLENPYGVVTDASGRFALEEVPPGSHTLRIWHEALGEKTVDVTVEAGKTAVLNADF